MARYAINAEGATLLRGLAKQLYTEANSILESSAVLESKIFTVGDELGIYESEILEVIQQNRNTLNTNRVNILNLAQLVLQKANEIDEFVSLNLNETVISTGELTTSAGNNYSNNAVSLAPTRTTPRDLVETQFGFTKDGDGNMIYDSPEEMDQYLYSAQGSADQNFGGTCGLCSCVNILRLSGVNASEAEMINYASQTRDPYSPCRMLCTTGYSNSGLNGGTSPRSRQQILSYFGIDSGIFPIAYDSDGSFSYSNLSKIADYVSEGRGVIISVHAELLRNDKISKADEHAVTVTSVKKNNAGDVMGFYICDSSNGGTTYYPAERVRRSFTGSWMNVTYQIIR